MKPGDIVVCIDRGTQSHSHKAGDIHKIKDLQDASFADGRKDTYFNSTEEAMNTSGIWLSSVRLATAYEVAAYDLGIRNTSKYGKPESVVNKYQIY